MVVTQGFFVLLVIIGLVEDILCLKTKSNENVFDHLKCSYAGLVGSPSKMDNAPFACGNPEGVQRQAEEFFKPIEIYGKSKDEQEGRSESKSSKSRFGIDGSFIRIPKFENYPRKTGIEKGISMKPDDKCSKSKLPCGSNEITKKLIDIESVENIASIESVENITSIESVGSGASNDLPDSYNKIMGYLVKNGKPRISLSPVSTKTPGFDSWDKSGESDNIQDISSKNPRFGIGDVKSRIQNILGNEKSARLKSPVSVTGVSSSDNLCRDNSKISCGNNEKPEVTKGTDFQQNMQSDESGDSDELQDSSIKNPGFGIGDVTSIIQKILGNEKSARSKYPVSVTGVSSSDNLCRDNSKISCGNNEKPEVT